MPRKFESCRGRNSHLLGGEHNIDGPARKARHTAVAPKAQTRAKSAFLNASTGVVSRSRCACMARRFASVGRDSLSTAQMLFSRELSEHRD